MINSTLVLEGIEKSYGNIHALKGVGLEIRQGEIMALLGPNGAGKTTLLSVIAGLITADAGSVYVNGMPVRDGNPHTRRSIGLAPQNVGVYPSLSVLENLRFFGELSGLRRSQLQRNISEVIDTFALSSLITRRARTLSGGERRRLHTAMIVMHQPSLLLFDEPTTGVDVDTRTKLIATIRRLADEGSAVCYSTHYLGEVEQIGATIGILNDGRMLARCSLSNLIARHGESAVKMRFNGPAPKVAGYDSRISHDCLYVQLKKNPATHVAEIISRLGETSKRLKTVELIQPSLESVFLQLTGRQPTIGETESDNG